MLQQMSSPQCTQAGEVATAVRALEGRAFGDASSGASSDTAEDLELPQCKIKRNYNCVKCNYYTQNPRAYLVHLRDIHFEKLKIYYCAHCVYASRHHQKLIRHVKMMHGQSDTSTMKAEMEQPATTSAVESIEKPTASTVKDEPIDRIADVTDMMEPMERIEDMMEEVEDEVGEDFIEEEDVVELDGDSGDRDSTSAQPSTSSKGGKYFSCTKCNYVTHIRSRYTKHVKYHSMPMIKCTMCDFRTPYKWNLDRHNKNHGGTGSFHCSMCNFTADIKQSLTVHEMNHHTPPMNQAVTSRRRNRVGASDLTDGERPFRIADDAAHALITKEEEGSGDSRSSFSATETAIHYPDIEMISCNSGSNDATETSVKMEVKMEDWQVSNDQHSSNSQPDDLSSSRQSRKLPRPIPQLIPLNASTPNQNKTASTSGEPPLKKMKEMLNNVDEASELSATVKVENLTADISLTPVNNKNAASIKETPTRKKNESFFDKLKERLLTETGENGTLTCKNCGFESKCLSEHSVHEKNCTPQVNRSIVSTSVPSSGSTRCQNCRHRCKSSADLYVHMQTCEKVKQEVKTELEENQEVKKEVKTELEVKKEDKVESSSDQSRETQPHPMENVVFVWNNINQEDNDKFERPLDISINDDSTMPDSNKSYDHENNDENLSPTQAIGKKVFKCPHCPFWATTASRFHVHIVGHLNKKPFECSLCKYKSNWRWDITKHIKLKSARNSDHVNAKVLMTDETGRRNYSKYNRFIAIPLLNEAGQNEFIYLDQDAAAMDDSMDLDEPLTETNEGASTSHDMPLDLQTQHNDGKQDHDKSEAKKTKKTLWKCKRCNYKDPSKEALLEHVREHSMVHQDGSKSSNSKPEASKDPADLAYRCGHCHQLSNWKHVIQRHCRLKHEGVIKVIAIEKPKQDSQPFMDLNSDVCNKCPFRTNDKQVLRIHMQAHTPTPQSIFKCFFCPYFVKNENELPEHLVVHGVTDPEAYFAKVMALRAMNSTTESNNQKAEQQQDSGQTSAQASDQTSSQTSGQTSGQITVNASTPPTKRHKCTECPYETNSKSQYMYHEQFHRMNADTPYKCQECNYSVSKRHLLHQHMRVHGIFPKKNDAESEFEASTSQANATDAQSEHSTELDDFPFVWVAAKNEFHKMYKCRYCSYVNSQKFKLPNHEKIHCINSENSLVKVYKCLECKFTCDNSGRLAEHSKSHGEIYGRIYCAVHPDIPDEEQISNLRKLIEEEKTAISEDGAKEGQPKDDGKLLYFCQKCPARFFTEGELKIHDNSHDMSSSFKCKSCEYSVPVDAQLSAHVFVHSDDYRNKTKMLRMVHATHPDHDEPQLGLLNCSSTTAMIWVVASGNKQSDNAGRSTTKSFVETKSTPKQYRCKECPAKFFKTSTLNYHMGLHSGDGEHKCRSCSYSVKNTGHLAKHELLHENEGKTPSRDYDSGDDMDYKNIPLSGTDLFQRKTEAQKRVLTDKDKLVRPNDHFPPVLQADPQFGYLMHGNPEFIYPTYMKNGRQKEKRYKCHKCPSAFEKREQYKIHLSLHGSKQRYKCELCDYSVKYYANYVQHMRKHQMNDEAVAERRKVSGEFTENEAPENTLEDSTDDIKLAIKTMPRPAVVKSDFQQFSMIDQQTLRLLQRRRSINSNAKEAITPETPTTNRKMHLCCLCPYSNQRQDALQNHYRRHDAEDVLNAGYHKCTFCDLVVVQSHFLRDHIKTHFNYQKTLTPQCYSTSDDVTFTIESLEDDNVTETLGMDIDVKLTQCKDEKLVVQLSTGEIINLGA